MGNQLSISVATTQENTNQSYRGRVKKKRRRWNTLRHTRLSWSDWLKEYFRYKGSRVINAVKRETKWHSSENSVGRALKRLRLNGARLNHWIYRCTIEYIQFNFSIAHRWRKDGYQRVYKLGLDQLYPVLHNRTLFISQKSPNFHPPHFFDMVEPCFPL